MLEIIGSAVIGGLVLLIILQMNTGIVDSSATLSMTTNVQSNLTELTEELEYYFRKIGFDVDTSPIITWADTSKITFLSDIDANGIVDSVSFYISDTSALSMTTNPRDVLLYRKTNNETPVASNLGVVDFDLWYYNSSGNIAVTLAEIRFIKYSLTVQSIYPYNDEYPTVYIERVLQPNNLR